jgi:hypothetical protein
VTSARDVNETLHDETEMRRRRSCRETRRDRDVLKTSRDRLETETFKTKTTSLTSAMMAVMFCMPIGSATEVRQILITGLIKGLPVGGSSSFCSHR